MADFEHNTWEKFGSARDFSFLATDNDIKSVLLYALPQQYKPYSIITIHMEKRGTLYCEVATEYDVEEYLEIRARHKDVTSFFIRSAEISPDLEIEKVKVIHWHLTINGLVNLYPQPLSRKLGVRESHIGFVPIIINKVTGEKYEHIDYSKIFRSLRSGLAQILKFRVNAILDNGTVNPIRNLYMSERFATAAISGEIRTRFRPADEKS